MEYKRKEMFRMVFSNPHKATLRIVEIDGEPQVQLDETVILVDISLRGAKIECPHQYPADSQQVRLLLQLQLNEKLISLLGEIVWEKSLGKMNQYGIHFDIDTPIEKDLLWELKLFAKRNLQRKNS
ncbi:PilZ domain-containing protein [Brevibacillus ginsengisoli]|uniref:PilZ domain-containing protein n=1 Tax=Brevibacillus ginsengisoli TaxID=363854 RepID=UPI003CF1C58E